MKTPVETTYEFGPFEVNHVSGELLKHGHRVKLQEQPFRLLVILLENAGQVVTREQIQSRIWQGNTFVDFDGSLRVAMRKLREALGDDAENPRYIETIPKRGYRFLAPAVRPSGSVNELGTRISAAERGGGSRPSKKWIFASLILLLAAIGTATFLLFFHRRRVLSETDTVVVADFTNSTGDSVFDDTLRQGLAVELEQSPFLSLISEQRIQQTLRLMDQPAGARLTPQVAREICERTASAAVLDGSIATLGSHYVLGLHAQDCRTGDVLAEEQVQAARKEDVLNALGQIASQFRTRVGESLATVEKHSTPLAEATTPSLEALKAYTAALKVSSSHGDAAALPLFKHAVEIDPKFAMAHARLGLIYADVGESSLSAQSARTAWQLRERASDAEKFYIVVSYDLHVTGNLEKAEQDCEAWVQTYPRAISPHALLAAWVYPNSGKYEKAIEEAKKSIELNPDFALSYYQLAFNYAYLDRLREAENALQQASERKLEIADFALQRYDLAFLRGDMAGMQREAALGREKSGVEDWISDREAFVLAYSGHLQQAIRTSRHAADLAGQSDQRGRAALFQTGAALWEAFFGKALAAKQSAVAALGISRDRDVEYGAAFAQALSGDSSQAQAVASDLERRFPEDTSVKFTYLPAIRALIAMNRGEPSKAIELLQNGESYDLGTPLCSYPGFFGMLYPVYVRGLGYLAGRQGAEAAAEFQKILNHRGIVVSDPIGALAHLQLGRAYLLQGDTAKAKVAYSNFLLLWKDADFDIPVLKQAKLEYAKLSSSERQ